MASVKLTLDKRASRKDGTYPLKISVTHNGSALLSTGIHLIPDHFQNRHIVGCRGYKSLDDAAQFKILEKEALTNTNHINEKEMKRKIEQLKKSLNLAFDKIEQLESENELLKEQLNSQNKKTGA